MSSVRVVPETGSGEEALLLGLAVSAQLEGLRAGIHEPLLNDEDDDGVPDQLEHDARTAER